VSSPKTTSRGKLSEKHVDDVRQLHTDTVGVTDVSPVHTAAGLLAA